MRERLRTARRWVIKVGSSLLTADGRGLDTRIIHQWTTQIADLVAADREVILVSSGSIAEGIARLGWRQRPTLVHELQAAAAVGQMGVVQAYESGFARFGLRTALILLTHDDIANRRRYLNARATLNSLLKHQVIPVINENDTVITDEIRLGDNDTLAALVTNLLEADVLVLLTDQNGLYDRDPRRHPDAVLLERANASDPAIVALAGPSGSQFGSGGMTTKVIAARRAAQTGATTVIASGREPDILARLREGEPLGTMLTSDRTARDARKLWLSNQLRVKGQLMVDDGACQVLTERGSSLLSVGVVDCRGDFQRGELVSIMDSSNSEIARGLVNYDSSETRRIMGRSTRHFQELLGYTGEPELVHRDNLILTHR